MPNAVARFAGFAAEYDAARPHPPVKLAELLMQWAGAPSPDVVDLGAGTGLSAAIWAGRAASVVAVEPGDGMRAVAVRRLGLGPDPAPEPEPESDPGPADTDSPLPPLAAGSTTFSVRAGSAEDSGLPGACADIVTASQAMHWFDASRALPEIVRILRPGGIFAAYDCDWPPCIDWETDAGYAEFATRVTDLETARGLRPPHAGKRHLQRITASGLFRQAREIAVDSQEEGDARRLVDVALSQGGAVALLEAGVTEDEIGLTALREIAARRLTGPRTWRWTYRVAMAVK